MQRAALGKEPRPESDGATGTGVGRSPEDIVGPSSAECRRRRRLDRITQSYRYLCGWSPMEQPAGLDGRRTAKIQLVPAALEAHGADLG